MKFTLYTKSTSNRSLFFDLISDFVRWARELSSYQSINEFVLGELLMINLLLLAIGFIVLLVEIRLPLENYWQLPGYFFKKLLQNVRILPSPATWGIVMDDESEERIPLTLVELIDRKTLKVASYTFTSRLGEFGFKVEPGDYFVRAVKNYYRMPSFLDPENIELLAVDESFAIPVVIESKDDVPVVDMRLLRLRTEPTDSWMYRLSKYIRTFLIAMSNGAIAISIIISYFGWVIEESPVYGVLISVGIVMLFVKIYILEAVGLATKEDS